jgi:hypothetical protein
MQHKITIPCPNCKSNIEIVLDDNFNILDIKSYCEHKSKRIVFGSLKEGENGNKCRKML